MRIATTYLVVRIRTVRRLPKVLGFPGESVNCPVCGSELLPLMEAAELTSRHPNMPDEHAEPEDEDDERRRQLEQPAEDPRDRSVGAGGADDQEVVSDDGRRDDEQEDQGEPLGLGGWHEGRYSART